MLYLNEKNINGIGIPWENLIMTLEKAIKTLAVRDFAQPVKPYLRYRNLNNRIIAMPAFVGGEIDMAGIKWIASFPDNINHGLPRAHSVIILNNPATGEPVAILNTPLVSIIRTASVSGLVIKHFLRARPKSELTLAIIGWGPIGKYHFKLCTELFGTCITKIYLYDLRTIDPETIDTASRKKTIIADSWQEAYREADICITCTVSDAPYIDELPRAGSLQLNVSLRDYKTSIFQYVKDAIIVDDWQEVCRENTDIENFHKYNGLQKEDTLALTDVVMNDCMVNYPEEQPIMFNPMGMAVFDITIANYYLKSAKDKGSGTEL